MTADELFSELQNYYTENEKFPTPLEFSTYVKIPHDIIIKVYKRWLTQGKLIKKGNSYSFYEDDYNKLFYEEKKQEPDNMKISEEVKTVKIKNVVSTNVSNKILHIIVGLIGILLVLCSIHFTFEFNKQSMKVFWAFSLSFSIVSFMSIAFTVANFSKNKLIKCFVLFLWILGFIYSVFTAIAGQFNDFRQYVAQDKSEIVYNQKQLLQEQLNIQIKKQSELLHWREQEGEYSLNPDLKTENPGTWKSIQKGVSKLEEVENNITELQNQIIIISLNDIVSNETVYSWLCRVLKMNSNKLHFIIILFPSIFIDLCSGICFMFAMSIIHKEN